jgi:hypothetical protein
MGRRYGGYCGTWQGRVTRAVDQHRSQAVHDPDEIAV